MSAIVFGRTCEAILALGRAGILAHDQDHRILETALAARADFLVTGDKTHLQALKTFRGIRIVSPREFLDLIR